MRKKLAFGLVFLTCFNSFAAQNWFTVLGDPEQSQIDTAQLDTQSIGKNDPGQNLLFRVTLAAPRQLGPEKYQSYTSIISVDCDTRSIAHLYQVRFQGPQWTGSKISETFNQPKPMAFGGLPLELRKRIVSSACAARQHGKR